MLARLTPTIPATCRRSEMDGAGGEYPKALYQDGGTDLIWGNPVRTAIVHDGEEEEIMRLDGWRVHPIADPLDHDGDGKPGGSLPRRKVGDKSK